MDNVLHISRKKKSNLYQDLLLKSFCRLNKGRLDLELPDGGLLVIGDGKTAVRARIRILDSAFFKRCLLYGDIGFGEAYVDGLWDTDDIAAVVSWILLNTGHTDKFPGQEAAPFLLQLLKKWKPASSRSLRLTNRLPKQLSLGKDFFRLFLDPTMTWSGAWFRHDGMDLEEAQIAKYERLCQQLRLSPSDHVLEIGSGWGSNAIFMARKYGCRVTGITNSHEQYWWATRRVTLEGLEDRVTILQTDYRRLKGPFDKIVSVEMLKAPEPRFLDAWFRKCHELLRPDGILALQVITCPDSLYDGFRKRADWVEKHIFPGSQLSSVGAINAAVNRTGNMTLVDLKDLGLHYAATLKVWFMQFNSRLKEVRALGFDDRFIRQWNYYLCYREAAFRMRNIHMMQLVYARPGGLNR